ncbi:predicted protein [Nematostella vectensis]|uniref:DUF1772-domain-containing protein n=1 Tax=Nematostella vectensis TaxID=45351 RepID=A7SRF8_NEMVE|nr:predicted protein [Nematostella vectensis]|eukprot:XP_001625816.1 predicted protein [Nematostella vectensis]
MDADKIAPALKFTAVVGSGLLTGSSVKGLFADLPSLKEHSHGCILKILRLQFWRVGRIYMTLIPATTASGVTLYFMDKDKNMPYLVAGGLIASILPITHFLLMPVARPMLRPEAKEEMTEDKVRSSLDTLGKVHTIRCLVAMSAFGYLVYQLVK